MIEGFERMPFIKQPWHPPYYAAALRGGRAWTRPMDLLMYELVIADRSKILPVVFKLAEQVEPRHGITIRRMAGARCGEDMDRFAEVYNEAWSENWGFVPYSQEGPRRLRAGDAARLRPQLVHGRRDRRRARRRRSRSRSRTSTRC